MGNLATISFIIFLVSISISCARATYDDKEKTFLQCLDNHSSSGHSNILQHIHNSSSPTYTSLLTFATQNPRWFNDTGVRPFLIFVPREETEIRPVIICSKMLGHQIRVKSGGHDYEGLSFRSETPFIMIDVAELNQIIIDLEDESAWIQSGVKLGQLYYEIAKKSNVHAFPGGLYPNVGSGGHISGGGFGTLLRKYGLAADNVIDARVMDVNGIIHDRQSMGEELFWAIRGGGGASFGVILAWKLKLVRVPEKVTAFTFRRKLEPSNLELLQKWQNAAPELTQDLFIRIIVQGTTINYTTGERIVTLSYQGLFLGPAENLTCLFKKTFPEFDLETEDCFRPPVGNNSCTDKPCIKKECYELPWIRSVLYFAGKTPDQPLEVLVEKKTNKNNFYKGTSDFLKAPIPDKGWNMIQEMILSELRSMIIMDPFGGKMNEISENATPFPHREDNKFSIQYLSYWNLNTEEEAGKHVKWIRDLRDKMTIYVSQGPRTAYLNYKDLDLGKNDQNCSYDEAKIWGEAYFKGNFERLARVKGKVDPCNFFRNEQSIPVLL